MLNVPTRLQRAGRNGATQTFRSNDGLTVVEVTRLGFECLPPKFSYRVIANRPNTYAPAGSEGQIQCRAEDLTDELEKALREIPTGGVA